MNLDDVAIDALEATLPPRAALAFAEARARMLASGRSVLESEGGMIYETLPDGRRRPVMAIEPPVPVTKGSRFVLR